MKASCLQENLTNHLAIVGRGLDRRNAPQPTVLITAAKGELTLMTRGLNACYKSSMPAMIEEDGQIVIPHRLLADLVNTLPPERVDLELEQPEDGRGSILHIACSSAYARMEVAGLNQAPVEPVIGDVVSIEMPCAEFRRAVGMVAFSALTDPNRPALNGLHLQAEGNELTLAAADGFRLTVLTSELSRPLPEEEVKKALPHAQTMQDAARLVGAHDGTVQLDLELEGNQVVIRHDRLTIYAQNINAQFPNYQILIPDQWKTNVGMEIDDLKRAAQSAAIFASGGSNIVRLEAEPATGGDTAAALTVSGRSEDVGHNQTIVGLTEMEGDSNRVALNVRYLNDVLAAHGPGKLSMEMTTPSNAVVFRSAEHPRWLSVAMPMFVQW